MGAGAIALVAGLAIAAGGTAVSANASKKKAGALGQNMDKWLPTIDQYTDKYFADLKKFTPAASRIADDVGTADMSRALAMREQAMPGITEGTQSAFQALMPLLRGELPPAVMQAFMQSGAASSVGSGFGGSGFGFVNQGLFGARGALGAMQTGYGLLPALMSTLPQINSPSSAAFLQSIMTPAQRTQAQLQIRGQNLGLAQTISGIPTAGEQWGSFMTQAGGAIAGAGTTKMLGGGMGGAGTTGKSGGSITSPNYITPLP